MTAERLIWPGAQSIQEVIDLMSKRLSTLKSGQWLLGKGLSSALLAEQRLPNRYDLDQISTEIPIYIMSFDGHSYMGNSKLLAATRIEKGYQPLPGEIVELNEAGEPTGIFKETAVNAHIMQNCPPLYADDGDAKNAIRDCLLEAPSEVTPRSTLSTSSPPLL